MVEESFVWVPLGRGKYALFDKLAATVLGGRGREHPRAGSAFFDQLAASVVGRSLGWRGPMTERGLVTGRLLQTLSVTTQISISRRVPRFKLHP